MQSETLLSIFQVEILYLGHLLHVAEGGCTGLLLHGCRPVLRLHTAAILITSFQTLTRLEEEEEETSISEGEEDEEEVEVLVHIISLSFRLMYSTQPRHQGGKARQVFLLWRHVKTLKQKEEKKDHGTGLLREEAVEAVAVSFLLLIIIIHSILTVAFHKEELLRLSMEEQRQEEI